MLRATDIYPRSSLQRVRQYSLLSRIYFLSGDSERCNFPGQQKISAFG
jgi:hypothetical protein